MDGLGLASATVVANDDPEKLARVKITLPLLDQTNVSDWIPLASPFGARKSKLPIIPEVGSEVVVGFLNNDARRPVVLGQIVNQVDS